MTNFSFVDILLYYSSSLYTEHFYKFCSTKGTILNKHHLVMKLFYLFSLLLKKKKKVGFNPGCTLQSLVSNILHAVPLIITVSGFWESRGNELSQKFLPSTFFQPRPKNWWYTSSFSGSQSVLHQAY